MKKSQSAWLVPRLPFSRHAPRRSDLSGAHPLDQIVAILFCDFARFVILSVRRRELGPRVRQDKVLGTPSPLPYIEPRLIWH